MIVSLSSLASCELETSDAGDLEGLWHLTRVDTLATGGVLDLSQKYIYWSFQFKLMQADNKQGLHDIVLMRYDHTGNTLTLSSPHIYDREEGDHPQTEPTRLRPYGINNLEEPFEVLKLSGSRMQLQSEMLKLTFRKF